MSVQDDEEFEKLLNEFISTQLQDVDTGLEDKAPLPAPEKAALSDEVAELPDLSEATQVESESDEEDSSLSMLKENEKALFKALLNFKGAVDQIAEEKKLKKARFEPEPMLLFPNYKPSSGKKIADDAFLGWEVMIKAHPDIIGKINPEASDEQLLDFAENTENESLQFALISYVEILIEMEGCEIAYKERKLKREKRKLERQVYEEHQRRINLMNRYIEAINRKKFPINAERLVKNYFKTAQKDAEGAFKALTTRPAIFSPIEFDKIKPRLFGLIKVKPQDGIRFNKIIGEFIKKLKA